jgi:hypothetical protein
MSIAAIIARQNREMTTTLARIHRCHPIVESTKGPTDYPANAL